MKTQMLSKSASLFSDHALLPPIPLQVTQRKSIIAYTNLQLDKIKINDLRSWEFMLRARTDALALLEAACRQAGSLSTWTMCWWLSFAAQRKMVKNKFILQLDCDHAPSKKERTMLISMIIQYNESLSTKRTVELSQKKRKKYDWNSKVPSNILDWLITSTVFIQVPQTKHNVCEVLLVWVEIFSSNLLQNRVKIVGSTTCLDSFRKPTMARLLAREKKEECYTSY